MALQETLHLGVDIKIIRKLCELTGQATCPNCLLDARCHDRSRPRDKCFFPTRRLYFGMRDAVYYIAGFFAPQDKNQLGNFYAEKETENP